MSPYHHTFIIPNPSSSNPVNISYYFIYVIHSGLLDELRKNTIIVIIANKHKKLQFRCSKGRKLNQECSHVSNRTLEYAILGQTGIQFVRVPVPICRRHKEESFIWNYSTKKDNKLQLGDGDVVYNLPSIVRCVPWGCTSQANAETQMKSRYKMSAELFAEFIMATINNG